jgi:CCR4-NOT transcription complex subunit 1
MVPPARPGTFSPNPTVQTSHGGTSRHSPHPSIGGLSAAASPSNNSPTGTSALTKIVVAQAYLLLSTIKEDKDDPSKWEGHTEQLRKVRAIHPMISASRGEVAEMFMLTILAPTAYR